MQELIDRLSEARGVAADPRSRSADADQRPLGRFVRDEEGLRFAVDKPVDESPLRRAAVLVDARDAFDLVDRLADDADVTERRPDFLTAAPDSEMWDATTAFLGRAVASLLNLHGAALASGALSRAASQLPAPGALLSTRDLVAITRLIRQGYQRRGTRLETFHAPVFTAFPLTAPLIGVALKINASRTGGAAFKLMLPGVAGGFAGATTTASLFSHPASDFAIQFQQEMEAEIVTWRHGRTGHEIESHSFRKISADRIVYGSGPDFITCRARSAPSTLLLRRAIQSAPNPARIPLSLLIGRSFRETLSFTSGVLNTSVSLEIETETRVEFEMTYDLLPGYEYLFEGSRVDTHFVHPNATPI